MMARHWITAWRNQGARGGRRQRQRIYRYFDCNWLSPWGDQKARISSISPTGCYIDSRLTVPPQGMHVRDISVTIPDGVISVHGTVLQATPGVGFAVRFADLDDETCTLLNRVVSAGC